VDRDEQIITHLCDNNPTTEYCNAKRMAALTCGNYNGPPTYSEVLIEAVKQFDMIKLNKS